MMRRLVMLALLLTSSWWAAVGQTVSYPWYDYPQVRPHELQPHRHSIAIPELRQGGVNLHLKLIVSPAGDVLHAMADSDMDALKYWPRFQDEVSKWKFTPFVRDGKAIAVEAEEYIQFIPPERLPTKHVAAPPLLPTSSVVITLTKSRCFGPCPAYVVGVSTMAGINFDGRSFVLAPGGHTAKVDPQKVRVLARKFVDADFYSMDERYAVGVTDGQTTTLSIAIDGHAKQVRDYFGSWDGMPLVISELQEAVITLARPERWVDGTGGLVATLQEEKYDFKSADAQVILKTAESRGDTTTVRGLLEAGVPLKPLSPESGDPASAATVGNLGFLTAASAHPDTLQVLIRAKASRNDQGDKDAALFNAADAGNLDATKALIAYGANPNVDFAKTIIIRARFESMLREKAGSVLIAAAGSGNPDVVREILRYHPDLEARDSEGKTALFAAVRFGAMDSNRPECVRLLVKAGAQMSAADPHGNTPLHDSSQASVQEELLKLGANVNARNREGETPIFTTLNDDGIPVLVRYGADLSIRNNKGETVVAAAKSKGMGRAKPLEEAMEAQKKR